MSELIVIGYPDPATAEKAREELLGLQQEYLLQLSDAVIATRDEKGRVRLNQLVQLWTLGAAAGSFWGLLMGLIFLHPLFGIVAGAAAGAIAGALSDYGIDDKFMQRLAEVLQPGQAALFLMAPRATGDRVIERLASHGGQVLRTNLDTAQEHRLREAFEQANRVTRNKAAASAA